MSRLILLLTSCYRPGLVRQVFLRITIDGKEFVDIEPKPEYAALFATMVTAQKVGYQELESPPSLRPLGYLGQLPHPCFDSGTTDASR